MKNKVLIVVVIILVLGGAGLFIAYKMWNKPHTQVEDVSSIKVTATELCNAYAADEAKANEQYLDKALEVTGTVSGTSQNQDGYKLITLHGDDVSSEVACTMRNKEADAAVGSLVTIKGFCSGSNLFGVQMTDCIIVK